mmetsp:Transcript_5854/g.24639  ORF Transcript_5854/g.24639 Transcript_5854/m.24639 type:complete len:245 (-) Transcript_5854:202-936(-)
MALRRRTSSPSAPTSPTTCCERYSSTSQPCTPRCRPPHCSRACLRPLRRRRRRRRSTAPPRCPRLPTLPAPSQASSRPCRPRVRWWPPAASRPPPSASPESGSKRPLACRPPPPQAARPPLQRAQPAWPRATLPLPPLSPPVRPALQRRLCRLALAPCLGSGSPPWRWGRSPRAVSRPRRCSAQQLLSWARPALAASRQRATPAPRRLAPWRTIADPCGPACRRCPVWPPLSAFLRRPALPLRL